MSLTNPSNIAINKCLYTDTVYNKERLNDYKNVKNDNRTKSLLYLTG